jgi:hypothetical protein
MLEPTATPFVVESFYADELTGQNNYEYTLNIPRGEKGETGETGPRGPQGILDEPPTDLRFYVRQATDNPAYTSPIGT